MWSHSRGNTVLNAKEKRVIETKIMKQRNKFRMERTLPNSKEIGEVLISDGEEGWYFMVCINPQRIKPIESAMDIILPGVTEEECLKAKLSRRRTKGIPEADWEMDEEKGVPLKITLGKEITHYKDYVEIENFGHFPKVIERTIEGKSMMREEVIRIEEYVTLDQRIFDPESVRFSEEARELAKKLFLH